MFDLLETIDTYIKEVLSGIITSNVSTMFEDLNTRTAEIAAEVSQTPQGYNSSIFTMVKTLSDNIMIPIAGIIISIILCYELISMVTERNNFHDIDSWMIFKWIMKSAISVWMLTHVYECVMAVFDIGSNIAARAGALIMYSTEIHSDDVVSTILGNLDTMETGELLGLCMETSVVSLCMRIISILIYVVTFGRMIEIYLYTSVAPIPFATLGNREWGQIGTNYIRGLFALAFQGFLLMICVGIYAAVIQNISAEGNAHTSLFTILGYAVVLCFTLFKTGGLSKQIFNAH